MTDSTVPPISQPTKLETLERDYGITKEISRVLGAIHDSADAFEALGDSTFAAAELNSSADARELRIAAFRLRGTSLQLARLLDEVSSAAGRLEGLAWAKQALELDGDEEVEGADASEEG